MNRLCLAVALGSALLGACAANPPSAATPSSTPLPATSQPSGMPAAMTVHVPPAEHDGAVGLTVTVPNAQWRFDRGARGVAFGGETKDLPDSLVFLWTFPAGTEFWVYGDPCHWMSTKPSTPALSAAAIVAGLAGQASRAASPVEDV